MGIIGNCVRVTALLVLVMATSNRCAPIPATTGLAQGQLPPCPDQRHSITSPWSNCVGTFTYRDGKKYVGEWRDNKRNGQGTITFANGTQYVGEFRDGKMHGQGTYTVTDGKKYVGEWRDNKLHGQGTVTGVTGKKYVGEFRDNERNGQGTMYSPGGAVLQDGIWRDGKLVAEQ